MLVVPKSFSFAQFIYQSEARRQVAFSCGRRGTALAVDEELVKALEHLIRHAPRATELAAGNAETQLGKALV